MRELKALEENGRKWAKDFHALLIDVYSQTEQGKSKLPEQEYQSVILQYQCLLDNGYAEESPPVIAAKKGKPKKTKGRNLLERLDMHWEAVLAFANHTDVPFTNNLAEREIRPAKSKIKVAGCFRTIQGAKAYARIHSFISTVRKHQYNPFNELINIFSGLTPQYRAPQQVYNKLNKAKFCAPFDVEQNLARRSIKVNTYRYLLLGYRK